MLYAILSIVVFTILTWLSNKKLPVQICPICAGVTLTWLLLLFGMGFGFLSVPRYEFITAVLMGASIGGAVTEIKKMFSKLRGKKESGKVESLKNDQQNCC